jgi:Rrf2 family protein
MNVSQKCQYALRALFELARRRGDGPTPLGEIAEVQAIPARFLEQILGQLRQGGFVASRRGSQGGYLLAADPASLSVGQIIRFIDGPFEPVPCVAGAEAADCPLYGGCAFLGLWQRAAGAVAGVFDETTFQDLMDQDDAARREHVPSYCI